MKYSVTGKESQIMGSCWKGSAMRFMFMYEFTSMVALAIIAVIACIFSSVFPLFLGKEGQNDKSWLISAIFSLIMLCSLNAVAFCNRKKHPNNQQAYLVGVGFVFFIIALLITLIAIENSVLKFESNESYTLFASIFIPLTIVGAIISLGLLIIKKNDSAEVVLNSKSIPPKDSSSYCVIDKPINPFILKIKKEREGIDLCINEFKNSNTPKCGTLEKIRIAEKLIQHCASINKCFSQEYDNSNLDLHDLALLYCLLISSKGVDLSSKIESIFAKVFNGATPEDVNNSLNQLSTFKIRVLQEIAKYANEEISTTKGLSSSKEKHIELKGFLKILQALPPPHNTDKGIKTINDIIEFSIEVVYLCINQATQSLGKHGCDLETAKKIAAESVCVIDNILKFQETINLTYNDNLLRTTKEALNRLNRLCKNPPSPSTLLVQSVTIPQLHESAKYSIPSLDS